MKSKTKINSLIQRLKVELKSAQHLNILTANDWYVVEEYLKITRPVACALDKLQGEKNGSQGFIIPVLLSTKHHISKQTGRVIINDFKRVMLTVLENRFNAYFQFNADNRELILAMASLPRFKVNCPETEEQRRIVRELLVDECIKLSEQPNEIETNEDLVTNESDDFFVSFNIQAIRRNSVENNVDAEVLRYISDSRINDEILDEYPLVRNVYFRYNTTLSASAVVERLFSQSLLIFAPRRNRLSPVNFEKTLLVKCNRKLINDDK